MNLNFIAKRDKVEKTKCGGNCLAMYCTGSDMVPMLGGNKHGVFGVSPRCDEPWVRLFFKTCAESMALSTDVFAIADCKSSSNRDVFQKETKSASTDKTDLTLNFIQADLEKCGAKGRIQTTEHVLFNFRGNYNVTKASRNHHPGTTTNTDSINQIHNDIGQWILAPKHVKEAIHGAGWRVGPREVLVCKCWGSHLPLGEVDSIVWRPTTTCRGKSAAACQRRCWQLDHCSDTLQSQSLSSHEKPSSPRLSLWEVARVVRSTVHEEHFIILLFTSHHHQEATPPTRRCGTGPNMRWRRWWRRRGTSAGEDDGRRWWRRRRTRRGTRRKWGTTRWSRSQCLRWGWWWRCRCRPFQWW